MKSFAIILAFILVVYQVDASEEEEGGDINIVIEQQVQLPGPPDVDECFEDIDTCADNELCVNNPGSYTCICADGYEKVKSICEDVDECSKDVAVCGDFSECINIVGSFSCKCTEGFEDVEGFCEDIDECNADNICGDNEACTNSIGSYTCICESGYFDSDNGCESCFMTYTAVDQDTFEWSTPNYPDNYPEDIVCGLNVTIPGTSTDTYGYLVAYSVTSTVMEPGKIHDSSNNNDCTMSLDRFTVYEAGTKVKELCGDVETGVLWETDNMEDVPKLITLLLQSNSEDGASAKGIKVLLNISVGTGMR